MKIHKLSLRNYKLTYVRNTYKDTNARRRLRQGVYKKPSMQACEHFYLP